jgi:hypothetical protein
MFLLAILTIIILLAQESVSICPFAPKKKRKKQNGKAREIACPCVALPSKRPIRASSACMRRALHFKVSIFHSPTLRRSLCTAV